MPSETTYVHLDTITNAVLMSKGFTMSEYKDAVNKPIKNILLLSAPKGVGEYDSHTGFRMIRGIAKIQEYFEQSQNTNVVPSKWIDFESVELMRQLTPVEISELLYIAHTYTHLHSPFYYKLQNNYIHLTLPEGITKVYYRKLDQFYSLLSVSITNNLEKKINDKRNVFLFKKNKKIMRLPMSEVKKLLPLLKEGVVFSFKKLKMDQEVYEIPIYLAEDRLKFVNRDFPEKDLLGNLCFDEKKQKWFFKEERGL
ncbi:hypothetical protein [Carnobacterium pleistocenium]|uniref:hypothetical protein n=1 Tax=Carnobacterium pleistocenium TaxID=181073 RepID=UPI000553C55E|nr:hypothetical protein [Carnobacterium pleistocenium]